MTTQGGTSWRFGTTLKWAAPEVLNDEGVRFESDVYSYAIVVWEIVSGLLPWQDANVNKLLVNVCRGNRPEVPKHAPSLLVSVMHGCWVHSPSNPLAFSDVLGMLEEL